MKAATLEWTPSHGWNSPGDIPGDAQLAIYFGARENLLKPAWLSELRALLPEAILVGCSTGGQILGGDVRDEPIVAMAMRFSDTKVAVAFRQIAEAGASRAAGAELGRELAGNGLRHIFVLSDGLKINGSGFVAGLMSAVESGVSITGGLAGDGSQFLETLVGANEEPVTGGLAAVGFYGDPIAVGAGIAGGWDEFGPKRRITRSQSNVLYDLDGKPALELYRKYLGDEAKGLPGTGLLYPLMIVDPTNRDRRLVRTILSIDEAAGSMTFAGDIPEGWSAQLMLGRFDRLADSAAEAVREAAVGIGPKTSDVATLIVSCIGRRILMGQNVIDETLAAQSAAAQSGASTIGFYSYGEIAPHSSGIQCELHNQTMTVTMLSERV